MAAIITNGTTGATGTHTATGVTQVIASGAFKAGSVQVELKADSLDYAPVYTFSSPGAISLQTASGSTVQVTVVGGQTPVVDVSCL